MIVFAWSGFPQYAARCVGAFVRATPEPVAVIATRPRVPVKGMEDLCGCLVRWIRLDEPFDLSTFQPSNLTLIVSGWGIPAFNRLADEVRHRGGRVICMVDNSFVLSAKEIVKAIRFRLKLRKTYDGFFVPGKSGRRLLRFYGVPDEKIAEGMYSADESLFTPGPPLSKREKKIIYVGQLCERKNVKRMCEAFLNAVASAGWTLEMYGSGPLRGELEGISARCPQIRVHDFLQPEELAAKYREARVFCLPSVEEHWGLVVHEAALSGCFLLLSDAVGAAKDFAVAENSLLFGAKDLDAMAVAFERVMMLDDVALENARRKSLRLSNDISVLKFCEGVRKLCRL